MARPGDRDGRRSRRGVPPAEPEEPARKRASDAEREDVASMLARAMVAGRLTPVEYSDRAAIAQAARYRDQLDGLLADLPGAVLHSSHGSDVLDLEAGVGGSISRRGYWKVPPTVRVRSWVGKVLLDLSEAECATSVVAVELATGMCSPTVVLPEGATVDVDDLRISAGSVRDETVHRRDRGELHVSVRGRHSFGDVVLRHPVRGRWERLRALPTEAPRSVARRVTGAGRPARPDARRPDGPER
ncbi:DUF1707 SHOCT-like domain-containing protein [Actinomycetospora termitidis]|uniref:DUF1707 domain-containing protein n=1 Tax=Actinomycetospora termitidis TaxID=3053470 RepID=A0ABT7M1Q6_9PSEU|nr:DUF1707 domain-containing protein [Actinomycetospora sp. Odt1-22]MDL5154598.1 DUF1707 domain-containing protein [Actinomycetospora sp. Odt1-22]